MINAPAEARRAIDGHGSCASARAGDSVASITVSFVIPAWNEEVHLAKCLRSIANQDVPTNVRAIETIVVDNQSTDGTCAVAARHEARVVTVAPGRASRARNGGARAAAGDWLAFIDADCELPPDWLEKCGRHLDDGSAVAVGAKLRAPGIGATWVERAWHAILDAGAPQRPAVARWLPGFNLLVRKRDFDDVGGFDEGLVTCEDCDLSYRLATRGKLVVDPEPATAHHGESKTLSQLFHREAWRGQGNLRLAMSRLGDWRNWISLALPVASMIGMAGAVAFAVLAASHRAGFWPFGAACLVLCLLPFGLLLTRVFRRAPAKMLPRIFAVFAVYLAARAMGLFLSAPRVAHEEA